MAKDRLTVLVCCNADGSEKNKLFVIGKNKHPRGFPKNHENLPVDYGFSNKAWMTGFLFKEYLMKWDRKLRLSGRFICLLIDNAPSHPDISN